MLSPQTIRGLAAECGFDLAGWTPAGPAAHAEEYRRWLADGFQAGMAWMGVDPELRADPRRRWPEARTLLIVGVSYFVGGPPAEYWQDPQRGRVARYAWGPDYHEVLVQRLRALGERVRREAGLASAPPQFVDTAPVLERDAAALAGLGFAGRNTQLIHPAYGSLVFLAGLALPFELPAVDVEPLPAGAGCGRCRRCLDACPTGALVAERRLDSRRCISYLTIEHRGPIPEELRPRMGRWVFGCDDCQTVCPWVRRFSRVAAAPFLEFDPELHAPRLAELVALDDAGFRRRFGATPLRRAKRAGLLRNAVIALANSGHPEAPAVLEWALADPDPVVRDCAQWAVKWCRERDADGGPE